MFSKKALLLLLAACSAANTHGADMGSEQWNRQTKRAKPAKRPKKSGKVGKKKGKKKNGPMPSGKKKPGPMPSVATEEPSAIPSSMPSCDAAETFPSIQDIVGQIEIEAAVLSQIPPCPDFTGIWSTSGRWDVFQQEDPTTIEFSGGTLIGCTENVVIYPDYLRLSLCGFDIAMTLRFQNNYGDVWLRSPGDPYVGGTPDGCHTLSAADGGGMTIEINDCT